MARCRPALLLVLALLCLVARADRLKLAAIMTDNMVLQRAPSKASIFGTATPGSVTTVLLRGEGYTAETNENGQWRVVLPPQPASSEPETISVMNTMDPTVGLLSNVLFGDVFFCSGQSNMEFSVVSDFNASWAFANAEKHNTIRLLAVKKTESSTPLEDMEDHLYGPWKEASAEALGQGQPGYTYFSAVCYYYGLTLSEQLKVPIGLIGSSYGGTPVERWTPPEFLSQCAPGQSNLRGNANSDLYNGQVNALTKMTIKGAIWYQGEANTGNPGNYTSKSGYACMFPKMIEGWRSKFSTNGETAGDFPFGFVMLAGYCATGDHRCTKAILLPELRDAQRAQLLSVPNARMPNVFMADAIDLPDPLVPSSSLGDIHPRNKLDVGTRLGWAALNLVYNQPFPLSGPVLKGCKASGSSLVLTVDEKTLYSDVLTLKSTSGFEVFDSITKKWLAAPVASVASPSATLEVPAGASVGGLRYLWERNPCCPDAYGAKTDFTCPRAACSLYAKKSDLPMDPFQVVVAASGECVLP